MCITFEMYKIKKCIKKKRNLCNLIFLVVKRYTIKFNFVSNRNYLSVPTTEVFNKRVTRIVRKQYSYKINQN